MWWFYFPCAISGIFENYYSVNTLLVFACALRVFYLIIYEKWNNSTSNDGPCCLCLALERHKLPVKPTLNNVCLSCNSACLVELHISASPERQIVSASAWCWGVCVLFPCQGVRVSLLQQPQPAVMPMLPLPVLVCASRRALGCGGMSLGQTRRRQDFLHIQSLYVLGFLIKYYFSIYLWRIELRFAIQVL